MFGLIPSQKARDFHKPRAQCASGSSGGGVTAALQGRELRVPHLREPDDDVVGHAHHVVHVVESLGEFPFICSQHLWDFGDHVLNFILLKT